MRTGCVKSDISISNENQGKWFLPRRLTYLRHDAIIVVVMFTYKSTNYLCSKTWISHEVPDTPHKSTKREITYHGFLRNLFFIRVFGIRTFVEETISSKRVKDLHSDVTSPLWSRKKYTSYCQPYLGSIPRVIFSSWLMGRAQSKWAISHKGENEKQKQCTDRKIFLPYLLSVSYQERIKWFYLFCERFLFSQISFKWRK